MVLRDELEAYVADLLKVSVYEDYCVNGLQVVGRDKIKRIVTGVSASQRLFREAIELKADAVFVHHGLFWKNTQHPLALTGFLGERVKMLHQNDVSLFGYHLPLDGDPALGNSALIARRLELEEIEFLPIDGMSVPIAAVGMLRKSLSFMDFVSLADARLDTRGLALEGHSGEVRQVYVLSGGGGGYFADAANAGADVMVTGELREDVVRSAEEMKVSLYAAGHYNSETWGIRALGEHLATKFKIDATFIDIPNPI